MTLIAGDFRDHIGQLNWDVLITDAPYGVGYPYESYDDSLENLDGIIEALRPYLETRRAFVFTGIKNLYRWPAPYWVLCWVTLGKAGGGLGRYGFNEWQPILAYGQDPKLKDRKVGYPDTYHDKSGGGGKRINNHHHPAEKPLSVMRWLIERVTRPGETILDPMCGTGTTLIAAAESQRNAIGIDIEPTYIQIAQQRTAQQPLWTTP